MNSTDQIAANHKNSGGNTMSLKQSLTRRLSLLAGSSLVAASLATVAFTGATLAPASALAANECAPIGVDPNANGATADTRTCAGATTYQTTGITYASDGALTVNSTGAMNVGTVGVNLTGNTTDNVIFTATGALTGTSGPVVDIRTASGAITATTTGFTATAPGVTNAIRLESTGAGNITYTKTGTNAAATINNDVAGADAAIAAITHGGNIVLTTTSNTGGSINGRLRGILAQTSGAGSVTVNITGPRGIYASAVDGIAAIDLMAGTGGVTVNLAGAAVGGRIVTQTESEIGDYSVDALALRVASASAVTINNTDGVVVGAVDFSGVTAGGVLFDNRGLGLTRGSPSTGLLPGGGRWMAAGDSVFSGQNDVLNMAGGVINSLESGSTINFGAGVDTINMDGVLVTKGAVISNLEVFNNSKRIYFGRQEDRLANGITGAATDLFADDVLSIHGATFTGSGSSHLYMDVILGGTGQEGCEVLTGAADCLDLRDGTTAGSTVITLNDVTPDATLSGYLPNGITLVDVSGSGTSAAVHFTLDPSVTNGYVSPLYGPAIDRPGAFVYLFRYDAVNQRHVLVSQPRNRDLFDYAVLSGAAQSIWSMTADTVTGRQTDLRAGTDGGSVWLRTNGEYSKRTVSTQFSAFDGTIAFDNSYKLYAGTVMGGMDLISGRVGKADYVVGAQIGYVSSSLDMKEAESSGRFTGATGGAYASLWSDSFFLDGTVNLNGLALDYASPSLGSKTTTYVNSVGASAEGGVRAALTQNTFAEPLLAVSWVRTSFEEISLSVGEVQPGDAESLRGGLGLRLGANMPGQVVNTTWFVTGRAWNEFEGESSGLVHNPGVDLPFSDDFSGKFGEAELGINLFNAANTFSGFLTSGVKFKDGYSAVDLSGGVRLAW